VVPGVPQPGWRCQVILADGTRFREPPMQAMRPTGVPLRPSTVVSDAAGVGIASCCSSGDNVARASPSTDSAASSTSTLPALFSPPLLGAVDLYNAPDTIEVVMDSFFENAFRKAGRVYRGAPPPVDPAAAAARVDAVRRAVAASTRNGGVRTAGLRADPLEDDFELRPAHPLSDEDAAVGAERSHAALEAAAASTSILPQQQQQLCRRSPHADPWYYDRVLVDAECTHDGSLRHVAKFGDTWGWDTMSARVALEPARLAAVVDTQHALLAAGFSLLRPGSGVLVYSTCSLTVAQNEGVVARFLAGHDDALLLPIADGATLEEAVDDSEGGDDAGACNDDETGADGVDSAARPTTGRSSGAGTQPPWVAGGLRGTRRFDPATSGTSGLFVARIGKVPLQGGGNAVAR